MARERDSAPETHEFSTLFLGAGPGGTGPLFNALRQKKLNLLLDKKIAIIDKGTGLCKTPLAKYRINSDSLTDTFLEIINEDPEFFKNALKTKTYKKLITYKGKNAPLSLVGRYLMNLGRSLEMHISSHAESRIFSRTKIISIEYLINKKIQVNAEKQTSDGIKPLQFISNSVVLGLGGSQQAAQIPEKEIGSIRLSAYKNKIILSDALLKHRNNKELKKQFNIRNKKIVILGSSHSAFSSASVLLNDPELGCGNSEIKIIYRTMPKLFYSSESVAREEGYNEFTSEDVCPLTKRVFRLAGLRFDSAKILKQILHLGSDNLNGLELIHSEDPYLKKHLDEADLIVSALGYTSSTVPVYAEDGKEIRLSCADGGPLVDNECRVLDSFKKPLPGVFGIGLASGFIPSGNLGGEPSFKGQTNGIWLYQNGVGEKILNQILA